MPLNSYRPLIPCVFLACGIATSCGQDIAARDAQLANGAAADASADYDAVRATLAGTTPLIDGIPPEGALRMGTSAAPDAHVAVLFSDLDAEVGPMLDGVIRSVHADLGDAVRTGQVLALLDDGRQQARLAAATAARDLARAEFARADGLLERGFLTSAQHEEALYRMRMADAALREAEVELAYTRVTAPFNGVITRRMTGTGRSVETGDPLFRVTALRTLRALVRVPERDARAMLPGTAAILTGEGGEQVRAVVIRISPAVDPASGTVELLLGVADPGPLRPGSGATVRFLAVPAERPRQ
jgi:membrane fusion protein, multidrug efflux system